MHINATKVWRGFPLSFTQFKNVGVPTLPFRHSYFHGFSKKEAQLVFSEVGGQGVSGVEA